MTLRVKLLGPANRLLLAGALTLALVMGVGRFYYTPLLPFMQAEYGFDADLAGLIASSNYAGYLLGSIAATFVRPGPRRILIFRIAIVLSVATTAGMGLTDSTGVWIVLRGLSGIASAYAMILATMVIAEALQAIDQPGRIAWMFSGVTIGIISSGLLAIYLGGHLSVDMMWFLGALVCIVMLPPILIDMRDTQLESEPAPRRRPLRQPRPIAFGPLLFAYICEGLGYAVYATFIMAMVKQYQDFSGGADWVWVMVGLGGMFSTVLWARLAGRIGYGVTLLLAFLVQIIGVAAPAISPAPWVAIMSAIMFGSTFITITVMAVAVGRNSINGRGVGILTAGFGFGQIISPAIAGYLVAAGITYSHALLGSAAVLIIGFLVLALPVLRRDLSTTPYRQERA